LYNKCGNMHGATLKIVADIKKKRFEWIGHVVRMDQGRTVRKVFERKPEGSKRRGRPRVRWLEDVEKDLREINVKELLTEGSR